MTNLNYSVGIVTYKYRFEKWFKPLLNQIKEFRPDIEIMVAVNGENNEEFDQQFRNNILEFISQKENTYVNMYPTFRGLCKMWNNLMINASNHKMLLLNDDITIRSPLFFDELENKFEQGWSDPRLDIFKINGSWSHCFADRRTIDKIGWFDERFLSMGEEDGDVEWRIGDLTEGGQIMSIQLPDIDNHVEQENCLVGMDKVNLKYAKFNLDFAYGYKYQVDNVNGKSYGLQPRKLICINPSPPLHTSEKFYWSNRDKL